MLHASQGSGCNPLPAAQTSPDPFRTLVRALVRRLGDYEPMDCLCIYVLVCLFVCVFVCVSVRACVCLTSYACLYVSLCMFICICLCVSMCLCVLLCHCGWCICLCDWVSENAFVCLPVSMYSSGSITCADPLRERLSGPCVHSSHTRGSMVPRELPGSKIYPPHQTSPHCL